jgi:hypothetical protein
MEALLAFWGICGIAAALIGEAKGRKAGQSLSIGLVFGVFGVLYVAVAPAPAPAPKGTKSVRCPRCDAKQNVPYLDKSYECWQCKQLVS